MKKILIWIVTVIMIQGSSSLFSKESLYINQQGIWVGEAEDYHIFDSKLAAGLTDYFKSVGAKSIVDFGCGQGEYVSFFRSNELTADGYDGNPTTVEATNGMCGVQDLSVPFYLGQYDWVLSLEVGEHIPKQYEEIFIENLMKHCQTGIVLSWAIKGQGGYGHVNEQNNNYIKAIFKRHGFINDVNAESYLRKNSSLGWFKKTIMVFVKPKQ